MIDFVQAEYDYLRNRNGADFFLALTPYANALSQRPEVAEVIAALEDETRASLDDFVAEQTQMIDDARAIRVELAEREPEIDNSGMAEPADPASHEWLRYDLDSFAKFDRLVDADVAIGYPSLPDDAADPSLVGRLLGILRGRLDAARYGEDRQNFNNPLRDDVDDLARRIPNLGERYRASLQRYRQRSRSLPGLALARLVYFGSDLVAEPVEIETDDDIRVLLDRAIHEWLQPKAIARKLVNGERLDDVETGIVARAEETLKGEAERFHRELVRRLAHVPMRREPAAPAARGRVRIPAVVRENIPVFVVSVLGLVVGTLILVYVFGIGG